MSDQNKQAPVATAELNEQDLETVAGGAGLVQEIYDVVNEIWTDLKGGADICEA